MEDILLVAAGGAVGTAIRAAATGVVSRAKPSEGETEVIGPSWLPQWGPLLLVNVIGSGAAGSLMVASSSNSVHLLASVGLLGAMTSWSGCIVEIARDLRKGRGKPALIHLLLSVALTAAAGFAAALSTQSILNMPANVGAGSP